MKITLCGSIAFYEEMLQIKSKLEQMGHEVKLPPSEIPDGNGNMLPVKQYYELRKNEKDDSSWIWDRKEEIMRKHFQKIEWSEAILVLNYPKRGIEGYIGINTVMEMGLAFHLRRKIYLLNKIPEIEHKEEILGMKPEVINNDLSMIN